MTVARVTEISSQSNRSFEDAIKQGIRRANETLRNVTGAWVKEQQVAVDAGRITGYRVNMLVTFVLDDPATRAVAGAPTMSSMPAAKKAPAKKAAKRGGRRR